MGRFKDLWIDAMIAEQDADVYERSRKARARRAYRRNLIDARTFERELFEAEREACDMRSKAVRILIQ